MYKCKEILIDKHYHLGYHTINKMNGDDSMTKLSNLKPGQSGIIKDIKLDGNARRRIMQLGITEGESIRVEKYAPLGDPLEISIRGYNLCFRKSEAEKIILV
jgi:ferrous iron transport protein A